MTINHNIENSLLTNIHISQYQATNSIQINSILKLHQHNMDQDQDTLQRNPMKQSLVWLVYTSFCLYLIATYSSYIN